jgi:hypothetical protein
MSDSDENVADEAEFDFDFDDAEDDPRFFYCPLLFVLSN